MVGQLHDIVASLPSGAPDAARATPVPMNRVRSVVDALLVRHPDLCIFHRGDPMSMEFAAALLARNPLQQREWLATDLVSGAGRPPTGGRGRHRRPRPERPVARATAALGLPLRVHRR